MWKVLFVSDPRFFCSSSDLVCVEKRKGVVQFIAVDGLVCLLIPMFVVFFSFSFSFLVVLLRFLDVLLL